MIAGIFLLLICHLSLFYIEWGINKLADVLHGTSNRRDPGS